MSTRSHIHPRESAYISNPLPKAHPGPSPGLVAIPRGIKRAVSPANTQPAKKRKAVDVAYEEGVEPEDEVAAAAANAALAGINTTKPKRAVRRNRNEEKRLRIFHKHAPQTYIERLERVRSQRMFLIDRNRSLSEDGCHESEVFDIAGSTGNIYQVTIGLMPKCTCPDAQNGNQCKHIVYVLVNVLKVRKDLAYQLAFLTTELSEIFANAPVTPQSSDAAGRTTTDTGGHRKPIDGDCPVCVMEFDSSDKPEDILWCKAACGNNIHRNCFEQWAKSKPGQAKCVYCRTLWKGDEESLKRISKGGVRNIEGYVNVASELGLSGERDVSSYNQNWVGSGVGGYRRRGYWYEHEVV